jgi:protoheme IX farnesyltransferase
LSTAELNIKQSEVIKKYFSIFLELAKIRITVFVAFSTSIGYLLAAGVFNTQMLWTTLGVFLLASGSSALNHVQEHKYDALMKRTMNRPIPNGDISSLGASVYSMLLVGLGSIVLFAATNLISLAIGLITLVWYNLIYTPLKRKNSLAIFPGSLVGALPPVIGWAATGRSIFEPEIMALALFFFIWQIPHFWILLLLHGDEYEGAGYPSLTNVFNKSQLSRITFIWIIALSISSFLIPFFSISSSIITTFLLVLLAGYLVYGSREIITGFTSRLIIRKSFMLVNIYVLLVVVLLAIDKLLLNEI